MAVSISSLIQVSSRLAQAVMTAPKSRSRVTWNRPERNVRRNDRDMWKPARGMMARLRGSTQNSSAASRLSAIGKIPAA